MNNALLTLILLIVAACNVMTLGLYLDQKRRSHRQTLKILDAVVGVRNHLESVSRDSRMRIMALRGRISDVADQFTQMRGEGYWTLDDVAGVATREGQMTRERIAQVKTRLADEEREDQQAKAKARHDRKRGHNA